MITHVLYVGGYGWFTLTGDDESAEEMRRHKAKWEGGVGRCRKAYANETEMSFSKCQNHPGFGARARHFCECPSCITTPLEAPEKL